MPDYRRRSILCSYARAKKETRLEAVVKRLLCQAAVDQEHQIIVAEEVTQQTNDAGQVVRMLEAVVENTGALPEKASSSRRTGRGTGLLRRRLRAGGLPETPGPPMRAPAAA